MVDQDFGDHGRAQAVRWMAFGSAGLAVLVTLIAVLVGTTALVAGGLAVVFAAAGLYGWSLGHGPRARILVAQGLIGQAVALTAALSGHPWQIDSHMVFFALMAMLVILVDVPAILFAAGMITLHHVSVSLLMPQLVYPSAEVLDSILRSLMHGAVVAVETAVLVVAVQVRAAMVLRMQAQFEVVRTASEQAEFARREAEQRADEARQATAAADFAAQEAMRLRGEAEQSVRAAAETHEALMASEQQMSSERQETVAQQTRLVESLRKAMAALAAGDLSVRVKLVNLPQYEDLARDFNHAVEQLGAAITVAMGASLDIRAQISEINSAAGSLSVRTERQAATLANTASAINELTASVESAAQVAAETSKVASQAEAVARESSAVASESIRAMGAIEASSGQIARITSVIDDIAFQTNLLALNAGVEAARAGEAGRGFAVVASEVRDLAQRSSASAREINDLISASETQVKSGVDLVNRTVASLQRIVASVEGISQRVSEIARSSEEQSAALANINGSVDNLDQVTQENVAMFEETTAASRSLDAMAETLREAMLSFQTAGAGQAAFRSAR